MNGVDQMEKWQEDFLEKLRKSKDSYFWYLFLKKDLDDISRAMIRTDNNKCPLVAITTDPFVRPLFALMDFWSAGRSLGLTDHQTRIVVQTTDGFHEFSDYDSQLRAAMMNVLGLVEPSTESSTESPQ